MSDPDFFTPLNVGLVDLEPHEEQFTEETAKAHALDIKRNWFPNDRFTQLEAHCVAGQWRVFVRLAEFGTVLTFDFCTTTDGHIVYMAVHAIRNAYLNGKHAGIITAQKLMHDQITKNLGLTQ